MEEWRTIEEFPDYEVSDDGRVRNGKTRHQLGIYDNGSGVLQVVMRRDTRPCGRAVHKLVATAFLDMPPGDDYIPMHIDGNPQNNEADNLVWKPRWFAVKMTKQRRQVMPRDDRPVLEVKTGIVYANALECARTIGALEEQIILTAQNRYGATYRGSSYEFV